MASIKPAVGQAHAKCFRHHVEEFLSMDPKDKIEIDWYSDHKDINGNERADRLAKVAAEMRCANVPATLTRTKERMLPR